MTRLGTYIAPLLLLGGCSLVNSLDNVKDQATAGSGGKSGGSGGADASVGGDTNGTGGGTASGGETSDSGADGAVGTGGKATGTGGAPADAGADGGTFVPGGDEGVIVAYDKPGGSPAPAPTLVVIDPKDGTVKNSEKIGAIRGLLNDPQTDLWYIMEQTGTPADPLTLHVRQLNATTGQWHELDTLDGVPSPASKLVALNGRVAYLSTPTPISPDPLTHTLTVLDTTDPKNVSILGGTALQRRPLPAGRKQGIVAGHSSASLVGGTLDVVLFSSVCPQTDAGVGECDVTLAAFAVGAGTTVTGGSTKVVGKVLDSGNVQIDRDTQRDAVVMAFPARIVPTDTSCATSPVDNGVIEKFSPSDFSGVGQAPVDFGIESQQLSGGAYDTCFDMMFLTTQLYDRAVWGVPLAGGAAIKSCQGQGGTTMFFEPRTRTLIRSATGGGLPQFFGLGGTAAAPVLGLKTLNKLPANFAPVTMAVREFKAVCPP